MCRKGFLLACLKYPFISDRIARCLGWNVPLFSGKYAVSFLAGMACFVAGRTVENHSSIKIIALKVLHILEFVVTLMLIKADFID